MNKLNKKNAGYVCLVLGGLFALGSLILFCMSNWVNLSAKKVDATVLAKYDISTSNGEEKCMVDLSYRVGDELVSTTYEYPTSLDDDVFDLEVYYDIKNPKNIVNAGWTFIPLWTVAFGLVILSFGLYLTEIFTFGLPDRYEPDATSTAIEKQLYEARERVENNLLPAIGSIAIMIFGIVLIILSYGWWAWIFAIGGAFITLYFMLDFVPAIREYIRIKSTSKIKGKVVEIDLDLDIEEDTKEDNTNSEE